MQKVTISNLNYKKMQILKLEFLNGKSYGTCTKIIGQCPAFFTQCTVQHITPANNNSRYHIRVLNRKCLDHSCAKDATESRKKKIALFIALQKCQYSVSNLPKSPLKTKDDPPSLL